MRFVRTASVVLALMCAFTMTASPLASADPAAQLVALGDSYMAAGSPATTIPGPYGPECKQATDDTAHLVAAAAPNLTFSDNACTGALTSDIYAGSVRGPQISALSPATKVVIVSIGGNDAGFEQMATDCLFALTCPDDRKAQFAANVAAATSRLPYTYSAIRQAAPNARVFTVGYLSILPPDATGCVVGLINTPKTISFLNGLQLQLNNAIATESHKAGFTPVIPVTSKEHSVCAADFQRFVSLTGSGAGDEGIPMHPTLIGRQFMAALVTQAINASGVV